MKRKAPSAKTIPHIVKFGKIEGENRGESSSLINPPIERSDDYFWLRDDLRKDEQVIQYLKEENQYTEEFMESTKDLQQILYDEMKSRIEDVDTTYPYSYGEKSTYKYYSGTVEGKSYKVYYRIDQSNNTTDTLLDVNELAKDKKYCDVKNVKASPSHKFLAYCVDYDGSEDYNIVIKDLKTNEFLLTVEKIFLASYQWAPDNKAIFYVRTDDTKRPYQLYYHKLNSLEESTENIPKLIFEETDPQFSIDFDISQNSRLLLIKSNSYDTDKCFYIDLEKNLDLKQVLPTTKKLKYSVDMHEDNLIIITNSDNATNFKLMYSKFPSCDFKDLRPYNKDQHIKSIVCFKNHIAVLFRENCFDHISIIGYENGEYIGWNHIKFDEIIHDVSFCDNYQYDTNELRIKYESLTQPEIIYDYNMKNQKLVALKRKHVPGYDSKKYQSVLVWAPSTFGVNVPISMVFKRSNPSDLFKEDPRLNFKKGRPLHLYGYGSYGACIDPVFDQKKICLLDRGFILATAYIRGGGELGYEWYLDGKMYNKMNTFNDMINAASYLIQKKYTTPELLVFEGRSAGGLLAGCMITMRPDLFKIVIAGVPFVDVLTSMCDPSIPLTTEEWEQWGNPNTLHDYYYISQYSPYDNLKSTHYPHTLFFAGLNDPRVGYWEPAKFIAKLRKLHKDNNIHLLKTNLDHGHFGTSGRYGVIEEKAFQYAFILKIFNIDSQ
jgi:oligopeptidase B